MSTFDRAASSYDRVGPRLFTYFGRRIVDLAGLLGGETVLDAACGSGAVLIPAARRSGALTVGIDLSVPMAKRARGAAERGALPNVRLVLMSATTLGFPQRTFDTLFCGFALDSFPQPHTALSEFGRVLRPRGTVALTVAERWWWEGDPRWEWHGPLLESLGINVSQEPRRLSTANSVAKALRGAGFTADYVAAEEFALSFSDFDEWWRWCWSHGYRRVLERLSPSKQERYRASCARRLGDAGIDGRLEVLSAVGHRLAS